MRLALGLLLAAFVVGCGKKGGDAPADGGPNADGSQTAPEGPSFTVTFPEKAEWREVPDLTPATKGFVLAGSDKHKPCAVWAWTLSAEERGQKSFAELGETYAKKAQTLGAQAYYSYGFDPKRGGGLGSWQSKASDVPGRENDPDTEAGVGRVLILGDKVYCVRVSGTGLGADDPQFKALVESLKPAEAQNQPAPPPPPDDDMRPLARLTTPPPAPATGLDTEGAAFLPGRSAFVRFVRFTEHAMYTSKFTLARYHYPSFRADGEYTFPAGGYYFLTGSDAPRNRLYISHFESFHDRHAKLIRYELPEKLGAGKVEPIVLEKGLTLKGSVYNFALTPDGRRAHIRLVLAQPQQGNSSVFTYTTTLVRVDTERMAVTGELTVPGVVKLLSAPDGKTAYALVPVPEDTKKWRQPHEAKIVETAVHVIDADTWKVARTFTVRGQADTFQIAPDGCLYRGTWGKLARTDPTKPGAAGERVADYSYVEDRSFVFGADGTRMYLSEERSHPYSLDVKELFDFGRLSIAPASMRSSMARDFGTPDLRPGVNREVFSTEGTMSPDGKCWYLRCGHVFWLAGAGPLPEVDPAVKWAP